MTIDPAALCRLAREISLENEVEAALTILQESFTGLTEAQAGDILAGHSTVVLDELGRFTVRKDETFYATSHRHALEAEYGSVVRLQGGWWKAYAVVTDVGPKDEQTFLGLTQAQRRMAYAAWGPEHPGDGPTPERVREACRMLRYARKPLHDLVAYVDHVPGNEDRFEHGPPPARLPVICRKVPAPPPWAVTAADLQEAYQNGIEWHGVHVTGHLDRYPPPAVYDEVAPAPRRVWGQAPRPFVGPPRPPVVVEVQSPDFEEMRMAIVAQAKAGAGFIELDWGEVIAEVPRAPFERWALRSGGATKEGHLHLAPPWENVSPPDLKMPGDNRDHTDWMIGAGLDPGDMYSDFFSDAAHKKRARRIQDAAEKAVAEIQRIRLGVKHAVLSGFGQVSGPVWIGKKGEIPPAGAIIVVRSANPDWLPAAMAATEHGGGGLIVERGGALAHLVSVLRERSVPILRWPGALTQLRDGIPLRLDLENGLAEILPHCLDLSREEDDREGLFPSR